MVETEKRLYIKNTQMQPKQIWWTNHKARLHNVELL